MGEEHEAAAEAAKPAKKNARPAPIAAAAPLAPEGPGVESDAARLAHLLDRIAKLEARIDAIGDKVQILGGLIESVAGRNPLDGVAKRLDEVEAFLHQVGRKFGVRNKPKAPAATKPVAACRSKVNRRIEGPDGMPLELSRGDVRSGELAIWLLENRPDLVERYPVKPNVVAG